MTQERKDKNMFAQKGEAEADSDVIRILGIDPSLENSGGINDAAFKAMYNQNVDGYMKQGYSESDAKAMANQG